MRVVSACFTPDVTGGVKKAKRRADAAAFGSVYSNGALIACCLKQRESQWPEKSRVLRAAVSGWWKSIVKKIIIIPSRPVCVGSAPETVTV